MIGLRELVLVAMVVLVLYGRSGVVKSRQVQTIRPWISPIRRTRTVGEPAGHGPVAIDRGTASSKRPSGRLKPFVLRGKPTVLVFDDPGRDGRGRLIITRQLILSGASPASLTETGREPHGAPGLESSVLNVQAKSL